MIDSTAVVRTAAANGSCHWNGGGTSSGIALPREIETYRPCKNHRNKIENRFLRGFGLLAPEGRLCRHRGKIRHTTLRPKPTEGTLAVKNFDFDHLGKGARVEYATGVAVLVSNFRSVRSLGWDHGNLHYWCGEQFVPKKSSDLLLFCLFHGLVISACTFTGRQSIQFVTMVKNIQLLRSTLPQACVQTRQILATYDDYYENLQQSNQARKQDRRALDASQSKYVSSKRLASPTGTGRGLMSYDRRKVAFES
jgi:hypothetical protein